MMIICVELMLLLVSKGGGGLHLHSRSSAAAFAWGEGPIFVLAVLDQCLYGAPKQDDGFARLLPKLYGPL